MPAVVSQLTVELAGLREDASAEFLSTWEDVRSNSEEYRELDGERVLVLVRLSGRGKTSGLGASASSRLAACPRLFGGPGACGPVPSCRGAASPGEAARSLPSARPDRQGDCDLELAAAGSFAGVSRAKRERVLDSDLVAFVHSGVAIGVGTRSDDLRPAFTRGWGPVSTDGRSLTFCVIAPPGSPARENIEGNGAIAVVFNPPTAGRALQLKGVVVEAREPKPAELERAERHLEAFVAEAEQVGVPPELTRRGFRRADLFAVTFSIYEVFDQTPGQRAGARL